MDVTITCVTSRLNFWCVSVCGISPVHKASCAEAKNELNDVPTIVLQNFHKEKGGGGIYGNVHL